MLFGDPFGTALFEGSQTSSDVPGRFPVALGGHPYLLDLTRYDRGTIQARRQPVDDGSEVGENSLNTEGLWTRAQSDWSLGAGQAYYDNPDSSRRRFSRSIGIDPWTRDCLNLLPVTEQKLTVSHATALFLEATNSRLWVGDNQTVKYTTDPTGTSPTFTTVTGTPAATITGMATDGYNLYVAYGASDLYKVAGNASAATALGATDTDTVGYVNGRLLAGHDNIVYEVDNAGTYTAEFTHPVTGWSVEGFAASPSFGYFWGSTGAGASAVYRIGAKEDGTLAAAVFSGQLPDGETLLDMDWYAGVMLVGTNLGFRVAQVSGDGGLFFGPLIETRKADGTAGEHAYGFVNGVTAYGQFAYFTMTWPHGTETCGLGRADLSRITDEGTPAWASDIQTTDDIVQATRAVAVFKGRPYFLVGATGLYGPTSDLDLVEEGWLESGRIRWGTLERKAGVEGSVGHDPLAGSVTMSMRSPSNNTFALVGSSSVAGEVEPSDDFDASSHFGEWLEAKVVLARDATDTTTGPALRRWQVRILPTPRRVDEIIAPLVLRPSVVTETGVQATQDILSEFEYLEGLVQSGRLVTYQEGQRSFLVYVDRLRLSWQKAMDLDWTDDYQTIEGVLLVRLVTVPQ